MSAVAAIDIDETTAAAALPERDPRGHKGTFGRVSIVAGSQTYAGAALLAGVAVLRSGAGLATLFVPASVRPFLLGRVPELILEALPEAADGTVDARTAAHVVMDRAHDALVIGPGLGTDMGALALVRRLSSRPGVPAVLDASAFDALTAVPGWWDRVRRPCVLTPHPGELLRLGIDPGSEQSDRRAAATEAAARWAQVVVLKGAGTVVAHPDGRFAEAAFEVPALGTAGTGDVLAGIVASLLAQGLDTFDAGLLGVYLHAQAGENLGERLGDAGMMATDLLPEIPRVRRHLVAIADREAGARLGFGHPASTRARD